MLLELLREGDVVEVVETVNRISKGIIVFFLDQKSIIGVVDSFDIEL